MTDLEVEDINKQALKDSLTFLVHPSRLYVGLKTEQVDKVFSVFVVVTDIDGNVVEGQQVKLDINYTAPGTAQQTTNPDKLMSEKKPVPYPILPSLFQNATSYTLTATVVDSEGRFGWIHLRFVTSFPGLENIASINFEIPTDQATNKEEEEEEEEEAEQKVPTDSVSLQVKGGKDTFEIGEEVKRSFNSTHHFILVHTYRSLTTFISLSRSCNLPI